MSVDARASSARSAQSHKPPPRMRPLLELRMTTNVPLVMFHVKAPVPRRAVGERGALKSSRGRYPTCSDRPSFSQTPQRRTGTGTRCGRQSLPFPTLQVVLVAALYHCMCVESVEHISGPRDDSTGIHGGGNRGELMWTSPRITPSVQTKPETGGSADDELAGGFEELDPPSEGSPEDSQTQGALQFDSATFLEALQALDEAITHVDRQRSRLRRQIAVAQKLASMNALPRRNPPPRRMSLRPPPPIPDKLVTAQDFHNPRVSAITRTYLQIFLTVMLLTVVIILLQTYLSTLL